MTGGRFQTCVFFLITTVDGRNPFRTTLKPWLVFTRASSFQSFLDGAGFRPSTVLFLFWFFFIVQRGAE